ncbi:MAG: 4'-phosphopantetheinyl transferase family protein [Legionellaceae bacterium]
MNLSENRIDIWSFKLNTPPTREDYELILSDEEKKRASRYHFERHQRRFAVARITLRKILADHLGVMPQHLKFDTHRHGKPFLSYPATPLEFNLSHSGEHALLAIGKTHPLGVDLEYFSNRPLIGLGRQVFSAEENNILQRLSPRDQPLFFFKLWAQKEAYIKAIGEGLSYPVAQLTAPHLMNNEQLLFKDPIYQKTWKMSSFMPAIACCAALCCAPSIEDIIYRVF